MILTARIGGTSRAPLIAGSSLILRRPVSSASLTLDDPDGSISVSLLDSVIVESPVDIVEDSGLPGAMLPGGWLPGGGTPTDYETTVLFRGYVVGIDIDPRGKASTKSRILKLDCRDMNWRLDNAPGYLTKSYRGKSDREIILDAISEIGLTEITATSSTVAEIETGLTVAFDGATLRDVLDEMARISGGVWWVDDATLYYHTEAAATAADWGIDTDSPDDSSTFDVEKLGVQSRHDFPLNSVYLVGPIDNDGRKASATASDATSISAIGTYKRKIEIKSVIASSYAQTLATQLVAAGKESRQTIRFQFDDEDGRFLTVNQKISVTCARLGISAQDFVTREVRISQRKAGISEFSVEAGDFRPTVTDLLRRLDAAFKSGTNVAIDIPGIDFEGSSSQAVNTGTSIANIDDFSDFTIAATISPESISGTHIICAKDDGSNKGWRLSITSANIIQLVRTKTSTNYSYSRSFTWVAGQVYRIVARSSGTGGVRFWVNGNELTTGGGQNAGSGTFDSEASSPFRVARSNAGNYFDGIIGGVVLWNIALPETTCLNLHNVKMSALPYLSNAGVIWPLDEFADGNSASGADSIRDRSGNDYHGTPANGPEGASMVFIAD